MKIKHYQNNEIIERGQIQHEELSNATKNLCIILALFLGTFFYAQNNPKTVVKSSQGQKSDSSIYQLFPTKNFFTFLKLDTRNGKMWQVHFKVNDAGRRGELILNPNPLINKEQEVIGRYTLYSSENIYNFLLLDQIDGSVYQVQWSDDINNRLVMSILASE